MALRITVLPAGTVLNAAGDSGAVSPSNSPRPINIDINVTALTGTSPSITFVATPAVSVIGHGSDYPVPAAWDNAKAVTTGAITTVGDHQITLTPVPEQDGSWPRIWKLSWTLAGTSPSATVTATCDN